MENAVMVDGVNPAEGRLRNRVICLGLFVMALSGRAAAETYAPTSQYQQRQLQGWTILVYQGFPDQHPELAERTLRLLDVQLFQITRVVADQPLEKIRQIKIWVELAEPHHRCMAYHPNAGWLRDNQMNPDKAKCVEIANAGNFLKWTIDQPWMVLHELAHGYHDQFLPQGFRNPDIVEVYQQGLDDQRYQSVLRISGRHDRHYAATNPMEYFAEASEAYFGTNDFYPFVSSELKQHDPDGYGVIERLWQGRRRVTAD